CASPSNSINAPKATPLRGAASAGLAKPARHVLTTASKCALRSFGNNGLVYELPVFSIFQRWADIRHLVRLPEDTQRVHVAMLDILSCALGIKIERIAQRCGRLNFKHGRTNPWSGTSQIDEIGRCTGGDGIDDTGRDLLPCKPLRELMYAPALVAHFRV